MIGSNSVLRRALQYSEIRSLSFVLLTFSRQFAPWFMQMNLPIFRHHRESATLMRTRYRMLLWARHTPLYPIKKWLCFLTAEKWEKGKKEGKNICKWLPTCELGCYFFPWVKGMPNSQKLAPLLQIIQSHSHNDLQCVGLHDCYCYIDFWVSGSPWLYYGLIIRYNSNLIRWMI